MRMRRGLASGRAGAGAYPQRERSIRFYRMVVSIFAHLLHHEAGHPVFALTISSKLKHPWVKRVCAQSSSLMAYGSVSLEDDFAEDCAVYLNPSRPAAESARAAPRLAIMRKRVFSGDPWTLKETQAH